MSAGQIPRFRGVAANLSALLLLFVPVMGFEGELAAQGIEAAVADSVLDNGFRVAVIENHQAPLVTALLAVRAGAITQRVGEEGIAHLYEHVLFRAYGSDPSFAEDAGNINASYNGTTDADVVTFFLVLPSDKTKEAIQILSRLVDGRRFRDRHLEAELPIVLDELARNRSNPRAALRRQVSRRLWGRDWHRFDVAGDSASLGTLTAQRLQEHFDRYYAPNNAVLIVTGDAEAPEVFEWAGERFEGWDRRGDAFPEPEARAPEPLERTSAVLVAGDVLELTVQVQMRAPGTGVDVESVRRVEALIELLNDPAGELQRVLVSRGPLQRLEVALQRRRVASTIHIEATAPSANAVEGVTRLLSSLGHIDEIVRRLDSPTAGSETESLTTTTIRRQRLWALDRALTTESAAMVAPYLAELWGLGGAEFLFDESPFDHISGVDDLEAAAIEFIRDQPKAIGILAPSSVIEILRSSLGTER